MNALEDIGVAPSNSTPSRLSGLNDLLARVEAAESADRELDWNIHLTVLGVEGAGMYGAQPSYTGSVDAALALTERVLPLWAVGLRQDTRSAFDGLWHAVLARRGSGREQHATWGSRPALAVAAAMLRALISQERPVSLSPQPGDS